MKPLITYTNPLSRTLAHYEQELTDTLRRCSVNYEGLPTLLVEGRPGIYGKAAMLHAALQNVTNHRDNMTTNLQTWSSLGLLEARLWQSKNARNIVLLHDPVPLRRQVGFDSLSRLWASRSVKHKAPIVMVHSEDARKAARQLLPQHDIVTALHPIRDVQRSTAKSVEPTVVVAGQYKPERDLAMLEALGPRLQAKGIRAKIYGRGWPSAIAGWSVHSRFISETEMDDVLAEAWAVLLPYDLYFQSGIAIRALEQGTLTVSPRTSFAEDLLGADSHSIINDSKSYKSCLDAITHTLHHQLAAEATFLKYRADVDNSWRNALLSALAVTA